MKMKMLKMMMPCFYNALAYPNQKVKISKSPKDLILWAV
jgi:hypothetical protein